MLVPYDVAHRKMPVPGTFRNTFFRKSRCPAGISGLLGGEKSVPVRAAACSRVDSARPR